MLDIIKDVESEIFIISKLIKSYDENFVLLENESNNFLVYSKSKILVDANNLIKESLSPILFLKESNSFDKPKLIDIINNIYQRVFEAIRLSHNAELQNLSLNISKLKISEINFSAYSSFINKSLNNLAPFDSSIIDDFIEAKEIVDSNILELKIEEERILNRKNRTKIFDFIFNRKSNIFLTEISNVLINSKINEYFGSETNSQNYNSDENVYDGNKATSRYSNNIFAKYLNI
jgi:hypothetical protein